MVTRAAIYARVSRPEESDILENSLVALREYVKRNGFDLIGEYVEIASGGDPDRTGFNRLVEDARHKRFDIVVAGSLSRLTRGGIEAALYVLQTFQSAGVGWHLVEQPTLNYDAGTPPLVRDVMLAVLAALDRDYRRRISEATKRALQRRKNLGVRLGYPKGRKQDRCGECGNAPSANVHRKEKHRFHGPGPCKICGRSPRAQVHVPFHHPFVKRKAPPLTQPQETAGERIAPISMSP